MIKHAGKNWAQLHYVREITRYYEETFLRVIVNHNAFVYILLSEVTKNKKWRL